MLFFFENSIERVLLRCDAKFVKNLSHVSVSFLNIDKNIGLFGFQSAIEFSAHCQYATNTRAD